MLNDGENYISIEAVKEITEADRYNTPFIIPNDGTDRHYCPYCGKLIKPVIDYRSINDTRYYHCDCEDAQKAYEINEQIEALKKKIPSEKYHVAPAVVKWN